MKIRPTAHRVLIARRALRAAIDRACIARGEAQWTNGYRAGAHIGEDPVFYNKEQWQWKRCDDAERQVERAITAYGTANRKRGRQDVRR